MGWTNWLSESQGNRIQVSWLSSVMVCVHQGPSGRFGVDGGKVGLGEHVADGFGGASGVHQVIDDEPPLAGALDGL